MTEQLKPTLEILNLYPYLQKLHTGEEQGLNPMPKRTFTKGLEAALAMEDAEAQKALFSALNSGIGAHLRGQKLVAEVAELKTQLSAKNPAGNHYLQSVESMRSYSKRIQALYDRCYKIEADAGRKPGNTSWMYFGHELAVFDQILSTQLNTVTAKIQATAEKAQDFNEAE